jgi:hypothetical protein
MVDYENYEKAYANFSFHIHVDELVKGMRG